MQIYAIYNCLQKYLCSRFWLIYVLDTSCQQLHPIVDIAMNNNFEHCHVLLLATPHDFLTSKVRFILTSTVTGSHSCSGKNLRVRLAYILLNMYYKHYGILMTPFLNLAIAMYYLYVVLIEPTNCIPLNWALDLYAHNIFDIVSLIIQSWLGLSENTRGFTNIAYVYNKSDVSFPTWQ